MRSAESCPVTTRALFSSDVNNLHKPWFGKRIAAMEREKRGTVLRAMRDTKRERGHQETLI
jgi:hypothetical protein